MGIKTFRIFNALGSAIFWDTIEEYISPKYNLIYHRSKEKDLVDISKIENLQIKMNQIAVQAHIASIKIDKFFDKSGAPVNVIICSPEIFNEYIHHFSDFKFSQYDEKNINNSGFEKIGKIGIREVYIHEEYNDNRIFMFNRYFSKCGVTITILD